MSSFVLHLFGSREKNPRQIKRRCLPLKKFITTCRARPLRTRLSSVRAINGPNGKTFGELFQREKTRPETKNDDKTKVRRKEGGWDEREGKKNIIVKPTRRRRRLPTCCAGKEIRQYRSGKPSKYLHRTIPILSSTIFHCYRIVTGLKAHEILLRCNQSTTTSSSARFVGGKVSLRVKPLPRFLSIRNRPFHKVPCITTGGGSWDSTEVEHKCSTPTPVDMLLSFNISYLTLFTDITCMRYTRILIVTWPAGLILHQLFSSSSIKIS